MMNDTTPSPFAASASSVCGGKHASAAYTSNGAMGPLNYWAPDSDTNQ